MLTAAVVVAASEVAKRSDRLGALIGAMPMVTLLAMVWLAVERQGTDKIGNHAFYTFWYVLPTLPGFLLVPWLLERGWGFWPVLGVYVATTAVLVVATAWLVRPFGIQLL